MKSDNIPYLNIVKLGIVSRDYTQKFPNNFRDFSFSMQNILLLLDKEKCDSVLFSLYSIVKRETFDMQMMLTRLKNIRCVLFEEIQDDINLNKDTIRNFIIFFKIDGVWTEYELHQKFGTIRDRTFNINEFVQNEIPKRVIGNCCILLCGEINAVKYSQKNKVVVDTFKFMPSIPNEVNIVLNPSHDRMIRPEMRYKRQFLSNNNRYLISVWNKGRKFGKGVTKDGKKPAWTVFNNGNEISVQLVPNQLGVELGIINTAINHDARN